ncbi:MAG: ribosome maturation factor RimM [Chloroflexota bacterium]|jgi:16S rRNA processing protein RimM|nr:ribosome maturation factor RimM [Chloroflexota bacterium]
MTDSSQPAYQPKRRPSPGRTYVHRNRSVFVPKGALAVGLVVGAHGLRGEVRVELHTDFPERFAPGNVVLMGDDLTEVLIVASRPHKNEMLVRFEGATDRTAADGLRGQWLFIEEQDAAELEEGVYWIHDIIGMDVQTDDGRRLGRVSDVLFTGANDVYLVKPAESINRGQDILLPAIPDVIQTVDVPARLITVKLMPGMIEE